jgi:hypothetical protein
MLTKDNVKIIKLIQPYCPKETVEEVFSILMTNQLFKELGLED